MYTLSYVHILLLWIKTSSEGYKGEQERRNTGMKVYNAIIIVDLLMSLGK